MKVFFSLKKFTGVNFLAAHFRPQDWAFFLLLFCFLSSFVLGWTSRHRPRMPAPLDDFTSEQIFTLPNLPSQRPESLDPLRLLASDGLSDDRLGLSVDFDNDTIVVGAIGDDVGENIDQGSAYLYVRSGQGWVQQQKLVAGDGAAGDRFGRSVAVSGDVVVIGAIGDDLTAGSDQGSAYVFVRSGGVWTEVQKLVAMDAADGDNFGESLDIHGETVVVGSNLDDIGANFNQGSAYVFVRTGSVWTVEQKLIANDGTSADNFGFDVAIDGNTIAIGAYADTVNFINNRGSAYVFTRAGNVWEQRQRLLAPDAAAFDFFGAAVAISGPRILVGAFGDDIGVNSNEGSAYFFTNVNEDWTFQQKVIGSSCVQNCLFGSNVALYSDVAIVAARPVQNAAYVFKNMGGSWSNAGSVSVAGGSASGFVTSVSLDDELAIVGSPSDDINGNTTQGSAYVVDLASFVTPTPTPTATSTPTATPTPTPTATPTATPTGFEADVSPRNQGDGNLASSDVVQMRRFVSGLDLPVQTSNEYQRADCAPRVSLGDGVLNAADVIQSRRYAAGLEPLTAAGGPEPTSFAEFLLVTNGDDCPICPEREIRIGPVQFMTYSTVIFPVSFFGRREDTGLGFTIEFDSTRLGTPTVLLNERFDEKTSITINNRNPGRIGILLDSQSSLSDYHLLFIKFESNLSASAAIGLRFTGSVVKKSVSTRWGELVASKWSVDD